MSHGLSESFSQVVLLSVRFLAVNIQLPFSPANVLTIPMVRSSDAAAIQYDSSLTLDEADCEQFVTWLRSGLIVLLRQ